MFASRNAIKVYPMLAIYYELKVSEAAVLFGVSVPKRNFKSSVKRNRFKRLIRESYRLNKHLLTEKLEDAGKSYAIMFLYIGKEESTYVKIEGKMKEILNALASNFLS